MIDVADLVLIPTRPSPHDLRAAGATVELVERLMKPMVFVINGASPRARITTEAAIALSQYGPVAPSVVHQRIDFAASMIDGRTVMELSGRSRSRQEVAELWEFLSRRLSGSALKPMQTVRPAKTASVTAAPVNGTEERQGVS